jgi:hypothetical protein
LAARFEHQVSASRLAQKPLPQPPLFGVVELAVVESPTRTKEASMSLSLLWPLPLPLPLLRAATSGAGMANAAGRSRAERRRCDSMVGGGSAVVRWVMDEQALVHRIGRSYS